MFRANQQVTHPGGSYQEVEDGTRTKSARLIVLLPALRQHALTRSTRHAYH